MTRYAVLAPNHDQAEVFDTLDRAVEYFDSLKDDTFAVFALRGLSDSELWDWATRPAGSLKTPVLIYVNERSARNCLTDGYEMVKRRAGKSEWVAGDAA